MSKRKTIFLHPAWLLLVVSAFACSKADVSLAPETSTTLKVTSIDPQGKAIEAAAVILDGEILGETPYNGSDLEAGSRALRLIKDGYQMYTRQVDIVEGQSHTIEVVLDPLPPDKGELVVTTNLDSVDVEVADSHENIVGSAQTRAASFVLTGGAYIVSGAKTGLATVIEAVEVVAGQTVTVNLQLVNPANPPATLTFSVAEDTVEAGQTASLSWTSDGVKVIIDQGVGERGPNGSEKVACQETGMKIFTATAYNADNVTTEKKDTVYVTPSDKLPPTLEFSAEADTVEVGSDIRLQWQSDGTKVIIDNAIGTQEPVGSFVYATTSAGMKIFTAIAFSADNLTKEVRDTVVVREPVIAPPSLQFDIVEDSVTFGDPVHLQWQTDGHQVVMDNGVGVRGPVGAEELQFVNPGWKIITATAYGQDNRFTIKKDSVLIKEADAPAKPVILLSTSRLVSINMPATITWFSQNADYVVIDYVDNPGLQGSVEKTFASPGFRIVTATAFNQAGYTSATDTIQVVEPLVEPVDDIIILAQNEVRADQGDQGAIKFNAASFEIKKSGTYRIYTEIWYNSGDSQRNESFYLQIRSPNGQVTPPADANAGINKIVPDDPGEPHTVSRESGSFNFTTGTHTIDLYHYVKVADFYPQFLNGSIDGPESVKVLGFKIIYTE